jgi:hypothetical protein
MKKILFSSALLPAFLIFSLTLQAQTKERNGYIGMSVGLSFAEGNVKNNLQTSRGAGLSAFNFGYVFKKGFGVTGAWTGAYNESKLPLTVLSQGLYENLPTNWTVVYSGFAIGPMYSINISGRLVFDIKARIGRFNTKEKIQNDKLCGTKEGISFGYSFGTALRYHLSNNWSVIVHGDYMSCKYFSIYSPGRLNTLSANAGLAFRFK